MQTRWFWKHWHKAYQRIGFGVALLFLSSLLFLWITYFSGIDSVIHWQNIFDQKSIETTAHSFQIGLFEFSVPIESYITFEYFNGGNLQPNIPAQYIFIFLFTATIILLLTIITTFKRLWYFIGIGLFILVVVSLRLEVLRLFGIYTQWTTVAVLTLYVAVSFYFHSFSHLSFLVRLLAFIAITAVLGIFIYYFATVPYPFIHVAITGYITGLVLTILFTIMVAHEILASFIFLTSQGSTSTKSLNHFLIISVIYLANLMLAYLHEARIVDWNFLYVNVYVLLTISAVLGIWGYRKREPLYQHITNFDPFGAYFIAGLASIAFATIGLLLGTGNDAALKVIRDFIIFSHLGFGIIFMTYIFSNFIMMMAENMNVYKVLYNPNRMPYITYRIAGLIAMLAFVFYSNWREYVYHGTAGFFNSLGDLYTLMDKSAFAEAYYQKGRSFGFQNHHSNYVLAQTEAHRNNFDKAHNYYEAANAKRPSQFSLVNDGNLYLTEEKIFKAIFAFKKALQEFPGSGVIKNNLGYTYTKIHLLDSALLMFNEAREQNKSKDAAELNFTAFIAQEYLPIKGDSLSKLLNSTSHGVASNALVIATTQKQLYSASINPFENRELDLLTATMLNNYIVNKVKDLDTAFITKAYSFATDSLNNGYSEALRASLAYAYYHQNNVTQALRIFGELAYLTQSRQGKYNYIMGLWALEQGDPELAAQSFSYAVQYSYKEAKVYQAIALAESHQLSAALVATDSLLNSKLAEEVEIGKQLKSILTATPSSILQQSDANKYQFCRYRIALHDSIVFNRITSSIQDVNLKVQAILDMSQRQFDHAYTEAAIRYFNKLNGLKMTDKKLYDRMQYLELELMASRGQLRLLAQKINEGITFPNSKNLEKLLYTAMLSEASGDTLTATKNYSLLATYNPFYEEGIIAAARYFKQHSTDAFKAYNILTDAIHVNKKSARLLNAYIAEAARMGLDKYAADAEGVLLEIRKNE